jgi:hypothetical protein
VGEPTPPFLAEPLFADACVELSQETELWLTAYGILRDDRTANVASLLCSMPGGKRQVEHRDYKLEDVETIIPGFRPLVVVLPLQEDGGKLWCRAPWDRELVEVDIPYMSMMVFCGTMPHAGSAYSKDNTRLHLYVNSGHVTEKGLVTYTLP